jgi:hypothetical protein
LLIEESRTNYIDNSTTLSFPFIGNGGTGVAPQVNTTTAVGPDGVSASITRCQFDRGVGNSNTDYTLIGFNNLITASAQYCQSVWLKSNDTNNYNIQFYDFGGFKGDEITVTPQWQRFILDANTSYKNSNDTANATPDLVIGLRNDPSNSNFYTGNTNSQTADILVWGPQIENGSFVTSYIPTSGTALTRSADTASITGTNFSSWFVQNNGSFYCKADLQSPASGGQAPIFSVDNSGANFRAASRRVNSGVRITTATDGIDITSPSAWNGEIKEFSLTWVANDCALVDSGTLIGIDTSTVNPLSTVNQLLIGNVNSGGFLTRMGGHIARLTYFPDRLPDATLQVITAT